MNEQFDKKHIIKQTATKTVYDDVCFSYNKEVVIPYWDHIAKHQEQIKQQNPELYKKMYGINY
ncbi:MAG: hypothetical protein MJ229_02755 [bacterium]|nr:hypothetical protein [bacterium]